ncbi:MAG: hypothetical protein ABI330_03255 [Caldimonas sp.]
MKAGALIGAWCLLAACAPCEGAAVDGASIARTMREARYSHGFEARLAVSTVAPDDRRGTTLRVAVIGRSLADASSVVVRSLVRLVGQPASVVARLQADGTVHAVRVESSATGPAVTIDPVADRPFAGLSIWDMLTPWWQWPRQALHGHANVGGRDCSLVTSSGAGPLAVRSVVSCIDLDGRIALRTDLFDANGERLRRIEVTQTMRNSKGSLSPKKIRITEPGQAPLEVDVYAGDEHYVIDPGAFSVLDGAAARGQAVGER